MRHGCCWLVDPRFWRRMICQKTSIWTFFHPLLMELCQKKLQRKQNKLLFCYINCSWNRGDEWLADTHTFRIWLNPGSQDTCSESPVLYTDVICYSLYSLVIMVLWIFRLREWERQFPSNATAFSWICHFLTEHMAAFLFMITIY